MKRIRDFLKSHREPISYLFWGVMTTIVSWGTYSLFVTVTKSVIIANVLSWICAILFAFVTNKLWVFRSMSWSPDTVLTELWTFVAARIATGFLEIAGVPFLINIGMNQRILGIEGMVAKVFVSVVVVILNYVLSKLLVFRNDGVSEKINSK
ncbi:MAG: GtrA family protein [Lachnospiraceae bacterium]|nr:GtrA family protein [Lachnospiraceae bacterium]